MFMKDKGPVLLPDLLSITKLQKSEGSPGSSVEDLGQSPRPRVRGRTAEGLWWAAEILQIWSLVKSKERANQWELLWGVNGHFWWWQPSLFQPWNCGTGCLDCCEHQSWVLEEKAPFSVCPGLVLSVVSLQAAVLKEGAGVTVWTRDHVTYNKPQLDQEESWVNWIPNASQEPSFSCLFVEGTIFLFIFTFGQTMLTFHLAT